MVDCFVRRMTYRVLVFVTIGTVLLSGRGLTEAASSQPCAPDLRSCPAGGCAQAGTSDALLNQLKRTRPTGGAPVPLTLDDFAALQARAEGVVGQKVSLTAAARKKLQRLATSAGQVSEGDLVALVGYLVGAPHPNNSGESVNCRLKGVDNNDFHIPVARESTATEFEGVVVEMIPQERPQGWSVIKLRRIAKDERPVLVRGQLLYDNKHSVNDDPDNPIGGQPKRFSLWEIHHVTEFYVCMAPSKRCDSRDLRSGWKALTEVP